MRNSRKSAAAFGVLMSLALVAAACGDDDDSGSATTTAGATTTAASGGATTTAAAGGATTTAAAGGQTGPMTVTYKLNPDAVWEDGTPITGDDFNCTWEATMKTPGSLSTVGYDLIESIESPDPTTVAVKFKQVYAPYKNLFNPMIKKAAVANCADVSADFGTELKISGREWMIQSWSPDQSVLVPNPKFWDTSRTPKAAKVVMAPKADSDTEVNSLKSGEVAFIFPQAFNGITTALNDPSIKYTPGYGTNYEGLYFQQKTGPFSDDAFRTGFAKMVDRNLILKNIYDPIFPGAPLLNCGLWVPTIGEWCDDTVFADYYNVAEGEKALTDGGWAKNGEGMWAKDGTVPEIKWMVVAGNSRRESTQALMLPEFKKLGFNVVADNCDAACNFQQRLPALQYDMAMYINTAAPDPTVTSIMSCSQVPGPENDNKGQNSTGWCNEEASKLMDTSDQELDETKRVEQIHQIAKFLADDAVMLPFFQFPNIAAWRTDKVSGPIDADAANYRAFSNNLYQWQPVGGDTITIGAEQWPECLNPITECANSSWYVWTAAFPVLPGAYDTTATGEYVTTSLLAGEAEVKVG